MPTRRSSASRRSIRWAARSASGVKAGVQSLLKALAYTEALIDFGEDAEDVTNDALAGAVERMKILRVEIEGHLGDGGRGEVVREGVRVAILGLPNAGKSTLLNAPAQRPAAIVSDVAGTTRDVVQVTLQLGGSPVLISTPRDCARRRSTR